MKIAVTYENGEVFQHFGHTEQFKIYDISDNKIVSSEIIGNGGSGHGALATLLSEKNIDVLICGGIGAGAQNALLSNGIKFFAGVSGDADKAVSDYLENKLNFNPNPFCNHHGNCGDHEGTCHQ